MLSVFIFVTPLLSDEEGNWSSTNVELIVQTYNGNAYSSVEFKLIPSGRIFCHAGSNNFQKIINESIRSITLVGSKVICDKRTGFFTITCTASTNSGAPCSISDTQQPLRYGEYTLEIYVDNYLKRSISYNNLDSRFVNSPYPGQNDLTIRYNIGDDVVWLFTNGSNTSDTDPVGPDWENITSYLSINWWSTQSFAAPKQEAFWQIDGVEINQPGGTVPEIIWLPYVDFTVTGYKIYRSINTQGGAPGTFSHIATVDVGDPRVWPDEALQLGGSWKVYYKIKAYNSSQESGFSNMVSTTSSGFFKQQSNARPLPELFTVEQNYPNPFNPTTRINYQIPTAGIVIIKIYDALGREIRTLLEEDKTAGSYSLNVDLSSFAGGVYYYQITAGSYNAVKKMTLIK